jgi:hypothetical protein
MSSRIAIPAVSGPIPVTGSSRPYRSAFVAESTLFVDLTEHDYVEEEFFLSGVADAVDPDGELLEALAPYATRILVRRPRTPAEFSGNVYVEPFHNLNEDTPAWTAEHAYVTRHGDAWIGLTVNAGTFGEPGTNRGGGVAHLRAFDPARYESLSLRAFTHGPPRAAPPGPGGFDPELMRWQLALAVAQGHGIAAGLFEFLRANADHGPLAGYPVERVYATGWSQTGLFWQHFLDRGFHEIARGTGDRPAVDGYLIAVAPGPDHRPRDAVVVNLLSEAEVVGTLNRGAGVAADTDVPRFRGYEVPGTFHHWKVKERAPRHQDAGRHDALHNDRPWEVLVDAVLDNMNRWVRDDVPMPHAARITRDPDAPDGVARDEFGNARGGLRSPWLDVPTARYLPRCSCSPVTGAMVPFTPAELARRYPRPRDLDRQWTGAIDRLVRERFLLEEDAAALRARPPD